MSNQKKDVPFQLVSDYQPSGDQPLAIKNLVDGLDQGKQNQVLLGVTGSGKTFTMANIIAKTQRPAIIMVHNKTLAAQIYSEMKTFFPNNAVEYFISFFDYYQPEAYVAASDTYIDKDSAINSKIEQMKHSTIYSLLERKDVIIIASVSSIYGIGEKDHYQSLAIQLSKGDIINSKKFLLRLIELQYIRNDIAFERGNFRVKGDTIDIYPTYNENSAVRVSFFGDEIERIHFFDTLTGEIQEELDFLRLYSASIFVTPKDIIGKAIPKIREELIDRIDYFKHQERYIEAQRIEERTNFDIEMLAVTGYCKGIENYTRYLSNKPKESTPSTLFDYISKDMLLFVDESHVSIPQIRAMYFGDRNRKENLVNYGFRLPSCLDNRPLKFEEWDKKRGSTIFVSATPAEFELNLCAGEIIEQVIRPTGLLDPLCVVRPLANQVEDTMEEIKKVKLRGEKALVVTLTKSNAEKVSMYLNENGIKAKYLHSDVQPIDRIEVIKSLRKEDCDVIVGINLLREGLDIPECSFISIMDADSEGFLRSKTSLVQTIGRAARNINGKVFLYADKMTESLKYAINETERRRNIQQKWNEENNITPKSVQSSILDISTIGGDYRVSKSSKANRDRVKNDLESLHQLINDEFITSDELIKQKENLEKEMRKASENLDFEHAIELREKIKQLDNKLLLIS